MIVLSKRSEKLISFFVCALCFMACSDPETCDRQEKASAPRVNLTVAIDDEMPGYFVFGGENYGYQYDLLKAYADARGLELEIVPYGNASERARKLQNGEVDFVSSFDAGLSETDKRQAVSICNTSFVLLTSKARAKKVQKLSHLDLASFIGDGKVLISSGFKHTAAYGMLLDSLAAAEIYVTSQNSFEMIEELSDAHYDYLICEMSEAQLGCAMTRNVEQIYTFAEPVGLSVMVTPRDSVLKRDFETWLNKYRCGEDYAVLNYLYFEKGIVRQMIGRGKTALKNGGISMFDELFKKVCEKEGYDWRLVSAIAYSESRFNPFLVSHRGAQGLMQIMPRVARQFDVEGDVMDPENNVLLALKILGKIENSLDFAPATSDTDRLKIVLACYNGGIGHVVDARNLARKYGANPDSWEVVADYLTKKSDPQYAHDDVVKNGRFIGKQTLAFVNNVMERYSLYCRNIAR